MACHLDDNCPWVFDEKCDGIGPFVIGFRAKKTFQCPKYSRKAQRRRLANCNLDCIYEKGILWKLIKGIKRFIILIINNERQRHWWFYSWRMYVFIWWRLQCTWYVEKLDPSLDAIIVSGRLRRSWFLLFMCKLTIKLI